MSPAIAFLCVHSYAYQPTMKPQTIGQDFTQASSASIPVIAALV